jgi:F0F1-type ATP synthase membrane subunit a
LTVSVIVMIVMIMMIMVMVVLVVVVQTMAARKKIPHRWALVVAFVITWLASLVTSMHL